ncbi:cellulose-binding protein [Aestuariicella hydrocarbonica]|uniref:Glycine cleavage system transcriptional repressor n=1 Tax=Pseudomaricurvus hydrocarbonicus TaxID=1470433 RepID=A0A9E5JSU2_9GAMM|nr:ACT domain-containing protein [Aestuariicella hydrocarbonica]NHO64801.1 cellulose-binding protein [Aestuariicella hydrocarbonica]
MNRSLVLSILSDDKPGVVEILAKTIANHQGNWLESRLSHLAGKFAGILQVSVPEDQLPALKESLAALQDQKGIEVVSAETTEGVSDTKLQLLHFNLMGNDRPGIIRELSQAFASHQINLDDLQTQCTSMPWSGDPMFTAQGLISLPANVDMDRLTDQLNDISDELGVDIELGAAEDSVTD